MGWTEMPSMHIWISSIIPIVHEPLTTPNLQCYNLQSDLLWRMFPKIESFISTQETEKIAEHFHQYTVLVCSCAKKREIYSAYTGISRVTSSSLNRFVPTMKLMNLTAHNSSTDLMAISTLWKTFSKMKQVEWDIEKFSMAMSWENSIFGTSKVENSLFDTKKI